MFSKVFRGMNQRCTATPPSTVRASQDRRSISWNETGETCLTYKIRMIRWTTVDDSFTVVFDPDTTNSKQQSVFRDNLAGCGARRPGAREKREISYAGPEGESPMALARVEESHAALLKV